jgi:predicted phage terminase large subunit-like protein
MLDATEALFGGSAGPGKSSALLMAALQYVMVPGYSAIILRRTYRDLALPGALMDRSKEWLSGTDARWNEIQHCWTFPSGAKLQFGYLEAETDKYRYQGAEFQGIFPDELTQFRETQHTYMYSRLRRLEKSPIPLRLWGASNPGGLGHAWVKQRFLIEGQKYGRVFVPALLKDNPHIDQASYVKSLSNLDATTRKQLLEGSWEAAVGTMFHRDWFSIVPKSKAPVGLRMIRVWDLAATEPAKGKDPDWTAGVLMGLWQGQYFIYDLEHFRGSPKFVEDKIKATAQADGRDVEVWMEEEGGSSGKITTDHYAREVLLGYAFRSQRSTGSKENRANPFSAAAERKNVFLVEGDWINDFLDEAEVFPEGEHDDQVDVCSQGTTILTNTASLDQGVGVAVIKKKPVNSDDD